MVGSPLVQAHSVYKAKARCGFVSVFEKLTFDRFEPYGYKLVTPLPSGALTNTEKPNMNVEIKMTKPIYIPQNFDFATLDVSGYGYNLNVLQEIADDWDLPNLVTDITGLPDLLIALLYDQRIEEGQPRLPEVERLILESGGPAALVDNLDLFRHPDIVFSGGC